ncbi:hypothetical protein EVAR_33887_1 [Eumeta japonica]|uniref:Uncharacterized protein n=1 Tax=Eumeta variegata TaxID=151549 RepID=A0A4C1WI69_EUMVA|nr:hypothetical protein EVAR_33887_1 [Eumeta japonica]
MRPIFGHSYRPLTAYDIANRPRHPDESCCARQITPDSCLQTAHQAKTSDLQMLHTLTLDLRCTGLVRSLLGTAVPMSPAEYSAPYDCGGRLWYVKNDVIARDLRVEILEEFVRMLERHAFNRADAGPYTTLQNLAPQYDRPTKGYQLPRDLTSKSPNEKKAHTRTCIRSRVQKTRDDDDDARNKLPVSASNLNVEEDSPKMMLAGIAQQRIHSILHEHLGMIKDSMRWDPMMLTEAQKQTRLNISRASLELEFLQQDPDNYLA